VGQQGARLPVPRQRGAFTYLEVLVALVILSLGLIALLSSYAYMVNTTEYSRRATIATQAAQSEMAQVRSLGYSWLTYMIATGTTTINANSDLPSALAPGTMTATLYQRSTTIVRVNVTVTWRQNAKVTGGSIALSSLVSQVEGS
jgi:type II secretory pathway pseudopilin PulG